MKLPSFKIVLVAFGLAVGVLSMTSCNKGYGCPSDFSVEAATEIPAAVTPSC